MTSHQPVESTPPNPIHDFTQLIEQRRRSGQRFLKFLDAGSLYCEIYSLAAGAADLQQPHREDEVYYVVRGEARIQIGAEDYPVRPGTVIFVPAGKPHRFFEIVADLELLVFFSKAAPHSTA